MGLSSVGAITERRAAVSLNSAIILGYMAAGFFFCQRDTKAEQPSELNVW